MNFVRLLVVHLLWQRELTLGGLQTHCPSELNRSEAAEYLHHFGVEFESLYR